MGPAQKRKKNGSGQNTFNTRNLDPAGSPIIHAIKTLKIKIH